MGAKFFYRDIDLVYFINNKLISNNLINQKDRVLLSFSGGQDSICFVYILNQLYCQLQLDITFFWCHHLWQIDSFYLMQQITKLSFCFQFNSCFTIPLKYISSELLARNWRQSCSYRISLFYNYSKICLAHTFNDKVENIFLNFMRGTGLIGLAPLRWIQFVSKPNITSEKPIARYNYLNYLSLKLNEPNICIPSIPENFEKLKNLTKEVIRKFMQKDFAVQRIANSANFTSINTSTNINRRFVKRSDAYKFSICTCKLPFIRFTRQVLPQYSVTQLLQIFDLYSKFLPLQGLQSYALQKLLPLYPVRIRGLMYKSEIYNSWQNKEGLLLKYVQSKAGAYCTTPSRGKITAGSQKHRGTALLLLYKSYKYNSKICTICKKQKKYLLQQHSATNLLPLQGSRVKAPCADSTRNSEGIVLTSMQRICKATLCRCLDLLLQQQEDLSPKVIEFFEKNSTHLLYELLCITKEPRRDLYSKPLRVNKNFSKASGKQLIDDCYIVRPLLSISRIELNKICYFWELPIYPDVSNQKVKFLRNRVRRQLLPAIKIFFNLNIENIFSQLATIVETEDYCLTQLMNEFTRNIGVYHIKLDLYSKIKNNYK